MTLSESFVAGQVLRITLLHFETGVAGSMYPRLHSESDAVAPKYLSQCFEEPQSLLHEPGAGQAPLVLPLKLPPDESALQRNPSFESENSIKFILFL